MPTPLFVTGSHRSGTTWVGQMLCGSGEASYIHEPFNLNVNQGWVATPLPYWYQYVCADNAEEFRPRIEPAFRLRFPMRGRPLRPLSSPRSTAVAALRFAASTTDRLRGRRPLVKDPLALFSSEWIAECFGVVPVVMIRHPAAFASSLQRLQWRFRFRNWLDQPLLLRDHLGPFEAGMRRMEGADAVDLIDEAALLWRAIYSTVDTFRRRHPDWIFLRHEDLSANAVPGFADLYRRLGLTWNRRAEDVVVQATSGAEAESRPGEVAPRARDSAAIGRLWASRLPAADVERLREAVADVAPAFYTDHDWA